MAVHHSGPGQKTPDFEIAGQETGPGAHLCVKLLTLSTVWGQYIVHDIVQTPDTHGVECDCNNNPPEDYSITCEQVSLENDPILTEMECIHIVRSQSQIEPTNPILDANPTSNPLIREQDLIMILLILPILHLRFVPTIGCFTPSGLISPNCVTFLSPREFNN